MHEKEINVLCMRQERKKGKNCGLCLPSTCFSYLNLHSSTGSMKGPLPKWNVLTVFAVEFLYVLVYRWKGPGHPASCNLKVAVVTTKNPAFFYQRHHCPQFMLLLRDMQAASFFSKFCSKNGWVFSIFHVVAFLIFQMLLWLGNSVQFRFQRKRKCFKWEKSAGACRVLGDR